jgi:hypothetical protein
VCVVKIHAKGDWKEIINNKFANCVKCLKQYATKPIKKMFGWERVGDN